MIEDLEGATVEPARRPHVAALSGAVAAVSCALLLVLILPPSREAAVPQTSSPVATPSASFTLTIASRPMNNVYIDLTRTIRCPDGMLLAPPYLVGFDVASGSSFAVQAGSTIIRSEPFPVVVGALPAGQVWTSADWSRSVPVTLIFDGQGRYIVTCATSDTAPLEGPVRD